MGFYSSKITIRKSDKLFSEYIRKRDGRCTYAVRCLPGRPWDLKELQCSHYHGRRKESVRFDPRNADAACAACHQYVHDNPSWLDAFKRVQLGQAQFDALLIAANTPGKRDDVMDALYCKGLLKSLA